MNLEDLNIVWISLGKTVQVEYEVLKEDRTYTAEDDEIPHPDFEKALEVFKPHFADAFEKVEKDPFTVKSIIIDSDDEGLHIILKGKLVTRHNESVNITSGKIPILDSDANLIKMIEEIRQEAFEYLFEGKCAQGKIDFDKKE